MGTIWAMRNGNGWKWLRGEDLNLRPLGYEFNVPPFLNSNQSAKPFVSRLFSPSDSMRSKPIGPNCIHLWARFGQRRFT